MMPIQYKYYLEWNANNFMYQTCVPTFMLNVMNLVDYEAKAVYDIQEKFHVERDFATISLNHYLANQKLCVR